MWAKSLSLEDCRFLEANREAKVLAGESHCSQVWATIKKAEIKLELPRQCPQTLLLKNIELLSYQETEFERTQTAIPEGWI